MNDNPESSLLKILLGSVVATGILTSIGFIADVTQIVTSEWFKELMATNIVKWLPYVINFVLSVVIIYLFWKYKTDGKRLTTSLHSTQKLLKAEFRLNNKLWKRYVRTLRAIILDTIATPSVRDSLAPLLDELAKKLPDHGIEFKIGVVRPYLDGSFKFLADRGMDPASVYSMEQKSNWKERKSFFANGLDLPDEKPFEKYKSGEPNYSNIQRDNGIGTSISHFVIAIKDPVYPESLFPKKTIAVLSIGIPQKHDLLSEEEEDLFYDRIFPIIKSIESMLLNYVLIKEKES